MIKIVGESKYGELLGGHIVGTRATELIQELVNVRALEGGFAEVGRIIHGHPTLSEAVMEAGTRSRRLADPRLSRERAARQLLLRPRKPARLPGRRARAAGATRARRVAAGARRRACRAPSASTPSAARPTRPCSARRSPRRADELGLQPLRWPDAVSLRQRARDARRDVCEVDRAHRAVRPGRLPPGLRRRARPRGARQRADRRRRLRDAPRGRAARRRAALGRRAARRGHAARDRNST